MDWPVFGSMDTTNAAFQTYVGNHAGFTTIVIGDGLKGSGVSGDPLIADSAKYKTVYQARQDSLALVAAINSAPRVFNANNTGYTGTGTHTLFTQSMPGGAPSILTLQVNLTVTAISSGTVTVTVDYTDQTNTARTKTFTTSATTPVAAIGTTGDASFPVMSLAAYGSTNVSCTVTFAGTSVAYVASWALVKNY